MQQNAYDRRRPTIVACIGYPGLGKTTQAEMVAAAIGVPRLRLGRSMKDRGYDKTPDEKDSPLLWYRRLLAYTDIYLNEVVVPCLNEHSWAVLDGFPRSVSEAEGLARLTQALNCNLTVLHFDIPDPQERRQFSRDRQRSRAVKRNLKINEDWYTGKIELAEKYELVSVQRLLELGAKVVSIDPRRSLIDIERSVRKILRLSIEELPWNREILSLVKRVTPQAYVVGNYFFQPFWNGVYGPMQNAPSIQVLIGPDEDATDVQRRLEESAPHHRWTITQQFQTDSINVSRELIAISGGVRLQNDGTIEAVFAPHTEAHLRRGFLQPSQHALSAEAMRCANILVRQYPGLRAPFVGHASAAVLPNWQTIHEATLAAEQGGKPHRTQQTVLEEQVGSELLAWSQAASKQPCAPPVPPKAHLPTSHPWEADDAAFCEWLLQDELSGSPEYAYVREILALMRNAPQKPTHQGWMTDQHTFASLLQLKTDHLPYAVRRPLRLAGLFHDLGKIQNFRTPGAHGQIGAKLWRSHAPHDMSPEDARLVTYLIAHHDLLGRLARGIKEPDFTGAVDARYIQTVLNECPGYPPDLALQLLESLNTADIASVAALRWTLPEIAFAIRIMRSCLE